MIKVTGLQTWLSDCRDLGCGLPWAKVFRVSLSANQGDLVVGYIIFEPLMSPVVT